MKEYAIVLMLLMFNVNSFSQAKLDTIFGNFSSDNRLNMVFVSEGYSQAELGKFLTDVKSLTGSIFTHEPFKEYKNYFNVFALSVASQESGTSNVSAGINKNTYFGTGFTGRLLWFRSDTGSQKVISLLSKMKPDYNLAVLIVNTQEYGGAGGTIPVISLNSQSVGLFLHETGHGFAGLIDEYDNDQSYPPYEGPNTTAQKQRDLIRWNVWINQSTPIPTPQTAQYQTNVGLFEGAAYRPTGWFRPQLKCMMRALADPYCSVCKENMIAKIYSHVSPVDSVFPVQDTIQFHENGPNILKVKRMQPETHTLTCKWIVNDKPIGSQSDSINIYASDLKVGMNKVVCTVEDLTSDVRMAGLKIALRDTVVWFVNKSQVTDVNSMLKRTNNYNLKINKQNVVLKWPQEKKIDFLNVVDCKGRVVETVKNANLTHGVLKCHLAQGLYFVMISGKGFKQIVPVILND
jgi:hypothetical protein